MLSVTQTTDELVIVDAAGTLTPEDYEHFESELESLAEEDQHMRVLIRLTNFHGWEPAALWKDVRIGIANRNVFERIAVVGDSAWHEWMTQLSKPFTGADVSFFDEEHAPGAVGWLLEKP